MFVSLVVNLIVTIFNQVVGLIRHRQQQQWVKTEHSVTRSSTQSNVGSIHES